MKQIYPGTCRPAVLVSCTRYSLYMQYVYMYLGTVISTDRCRCVRTCVHVPCVHQYTQPYITHVCSTTGTCLPDVPGTNTTSSHVVHQCVHPVLVLVLRVVHSTHVHTYTCNTRNLTLTRVHCMTYIIHTYITYTYISYIHTLTCRCTCATYVVYELCSNIQVDILDRYIIIICIFCIHATCHWHLSSFPRTTY